MPSSPEEVTKLQQAEDESKGLSFSHNPTPGRILERGKSRGGILLFNKAKLHTLALKWGEVLSWESWPPLLQAEASARQTGWRERAWESGLSGLTSFLQLLTGLGCLRSEASTEGGKESHVGWPYIISCSDNRPKRVMVAWCQRSPPVSRWPTPALGHLYKWPTNGKMLNITKQYMANQYSIVKLKNKIKQ